MHHRKRFGRKQLCSVLLAVSLIAGSVMPAFAAEAGLPEAGETETSISEGQAETDLSSGEEAAAVVNEESSESDGAAETEPDKEQGLGESAQTDGTQEPDISDGQDPAAEEDEPDPAETEAVNAAGTDDGTDGDALGEAGTEGTEGASEVPEVAERGALYFISQPDDVSAFAGNTVSLHVEVNESDVTYHWQWSPNGTSWVNCTSSGSNTDTFTFIMREVLAGRYYRCIASTADETVESEAAQITLAEPTLVFTAQPQDVSEFAGNTVTLHAEVNDSGAGYQWQWSLNETSWINCTSSGSDTDTFTFTMREALAGRYYRCVASTADETAESEAVQVTLAEPTLVFTAQPQDVSEFAGNTVTLHAEASDSGAGYQWQWSLNGTAWVNCTSSGSDTDTFTFIMREALAGRYYRCVASLDGETVASEAAQVTLAEHELAFTYQPQDVNAEDGGTVSLHVEVNENDVSYQWQWSLNGTAWVNCTSPGYDTDTFTFSMREALSGRYYRCEVRSANETIASNAALITLQSSSTPSITIINQPQSITVLYEAEVKLWVEAVSTDSEAQLSYMWESSYDGDNWYSMSYETEPELCLYPYQECKYRCLISCGDDSVYSDVATVSISNTPVIYNDPYDIYAAAATINSGDFYFEVGAYGDDLEYQWQVSTDDGATWNNCEGENDYIIEINDPEAVDGNLYRCVASNSYGTDTSEAARVYYNDGFYFTMQPQDVTVRVGEVVTFQAEAVDENSEEELEYHWRRAYYDEYEDCYYYGRIYPEPESARTPTLTLTASPQLDGQYFACEVYHDVYGEVYSEVAKLTVLTDLVIDSQPEDYYVLGYDYRAFFRIAAYGLNVTYQWQQSTDDGATWTNCPGQTGTELIVYDISSNDGNLYRCVVSDGEDTLISDAARLMRYQGFYFVNHPGDQNVEIGHVATFTAEAVDEDPDAEITYHWECGDEYGNYSPIEGAEGPILNVTATLENDGLFFRCKAESYHGTITSRPALLTIIEAPEITQQPTDLLIRTDEEAEFSVEATGGALQYDWQMSSDNGATWTSDPTNAGDPYSEDYNPAVLRVMDPIAWDGNLFRCIVSNEAGSVTSNPARLTTYYSGVTITQQPVDTESAPGQIAQFSVVAIDEDPDAELTYQWYYSPGYNYGGFHEAYTWFDLYDENDSVLSLNIDNDYGYSYNGGSFKCVVTSSIHGEAHSKPALFWYAPVCADTLQITRHPEDLPLMADNPEDVSASFTVVAEGDADAGEICYQWQYYDEDGDTWINIEDATSPTLIVPGVEEWAWKRYRCVVSNDEDSVISYKAFMIPVLPL